MALRISKTGAVYYDDSFTQKKLEAGRQHELLAVFGSTDTVPPIDSAYWMHGEEGSFQPEELVVLVEAFDEAWQQFERTGVLFASDRELEQARYKLGRYIIDQAKKGERDKAELRDGALLAYSQSVLQLPPRK
jgi:hypothetical protein